MSGAGQRELSYLFKLRLTANVEKLIKKTFSKGDWTNAGTRSSSAPCGSASLNSWQGREETPRPEGWSRQRWVVILRRRLKLLKLVSFFSDACLNGAGMLNALKGHLHGKPRGASRPQ